ncbi:MAG: hypothetical protein PHI58_02295 [Candidatus Omnitrophica bacterium]|nr:hypothetical protein [Candidatus Omnitrophota bacterium]
MKNKIIIVAVIAVAAVLALVFVRSCAVMKKGAKRSPAAAVKSEKAKVPAKKTFSKGMGGLTVKAKGSNNRPQFLKMRAFVSDGKGSSVFVAALTAGRMQELLPGTYDIEIETTPAKIYKDIRVNEGKETVEDLGPVTGSITVKALNSKKKEVFLPVKIMYPRTNYIAASIMTNRPAEIASGVYNINIETFPHQIKNGVKIEKGKETIIDLGVASGSLIIKTLDESGKEVRLSARVKDPKTGSVVASAVSNKAGEIAPGEYDIELSSVPIQVKKGVKIIAGEETAVEFSVKSQPVTQSQPAAQAAATVKRK